MGLYLPKLLISVARSEVASVVCCRWCQVQSACTAGDLRCVSASLRRMHGAAWATLGRVRLLLTREKLEFMLMYRSDYLECSWLLFVRILSISRSFRPNLRQRARKCRSRHLLLFRYLILNNKNYDHFVKNGHVPSKIPNHQDFMWISGHFGWLDGSKTTAQDYQGICEARFERPWPMSLTRSPTQWAPSLTRSPTQWAPSRIP